MYHVGPHSEQRCVCVCVWLPCRRVCLCWRCVYWSLLHIVWTGRASPPQTQRRPYSEWRLPCYTDTRRKTDCCSNISRKHFYILLGPLAVNRTNSCLNQNFSGDSRTDRWCWGRGGRSAGDHTPNLHHYIGFIILFCSTSLEINHKCISPYDFKVCVCWLKGRQRSARFGWKLCPVDMRWTGRMGRYWWVGLRGDVMLLTCCSPQPSWRIPPETRVRPERRWRLTGHTVTKVYRLLP